MPDQAHRDRDERRRAYLERTPRIVYREPDFFRPRSKITRLSRLGGVTLRAAHIAQVQSMTPDGRITPIRDVPEPEKLYVLGPSHNTAYEPAKAPREIRKMAPTDSRRYDRLGARIEALQHERKALVEAAFERGIPLTAAELRASAAKNRSAAERGYPRPPVRKPKATDA